MSHATRHASMGKVLVLMFLLACAGPVAVLGAAEDITGQWEMTLDFGGRASFATLTISKNADGTFAGKWGSADLSNVKFDGQKLTFTRTVKFGDNEFTMTYAGTLKDGKIAGQFSTDNGEFAANGARKKPLAPAVGQWDMQYKIGDRDVTGRLAVCAESGRQFGRQVDQRTRGKHHLQRQVPGGQALVRPHEQFQRQRVQVQLRGHRPGRQAHGRLQERAGRNGRERRSGSVRRSSALGT